MDSIRGFKKLSRGVLILSAERDETDKKPSYYGGLF